MTYTDNSVQSGQTYYYVVTAVNSQSTESVFSTEVSALVP
jgi:fibronectin type 3 domain-containing protein